MKLLAFGMLTFGYTIVVLFVYWAFSACGSGSCPPKVPYEALVFLTAALLVYVLASLLFWGWRPFNRDGNVQ